MSSAYGMLAGLAALSVFALAQPASALTMKQCSDPLVSGNTAFLGHGAGRHFWPEYLAVLECHADELAEDDLVRSARSAFDLFAHAAALS